MQRNTFFLYLLLITLSSFLIFSCAGTKNEADESLTTQNSDDKDLDDIEALLGITSDNTAEESKPAAKKQDKSEQLDLLETDEMVGQQDNSMAAAALAQQDAEQADPKEVENLKKQIRQKDQQISNLQNELLVKDNQIEDLSSQPATRSFAAPVGDVSPEEYKSTYESARSLFESRNYQAAIQQFEALLASSSSHSLSDNAQYWIGESHFALRQYDAAIIDFEKVLTFPNSNKKADAQFKLGFCYLLKKDRTKAMEEFDRLRAEYPESRLNNRVDGLLAKY